MASLHKRNEGGYWYIHYKDENGKKQKVSTKRKLRYEVEKDFTKWRWKRKDQESDFTRKVRAIGNRYNLDYDDVLDVLVDREYKQIFGSELTLVQ